MSSLELRGAVWSCTAPTECRSCHPGTADLAHLAGHNPHLALEGVIRSRISPGSQKQIAEGGRRGLEFWP